MFCGSCMHDNTWARALRDAGIDVTLIPTYTPIRVDEEDLSARRVFFGGINVYLEHKSKLWRTLPRWMTSWVDHPGLISLATRLGSGISNDAAELGSLTLDMLAGEDGSQRRDIEELASFLADDLRPDVVCFSNALLAGAVRRIRQRFSGTIVCTLQGDDIFLDSLPEEYRKQAIDRISRRAGDFDGILVHSDYYRDHMASLLSIPTEKFRRIPLGVDVTSFTDSITGRQIQSGNEVEQSAIPARRDNEFRIGYFARICPEKGLDLLIEAVRRLRQTFPNVRLVAGGFLGPRDQQWFDRLLNESQDLGESFTYAGSPSQHHEKVELLKSFDVLSVPCPYREPKGIYVLESLACGVPVVQPEHGAFPEMLAQTGGGILFQPGKIDSLVDCLGRLISDPELLAGLSADGKAGVRKAFSLEAMTNRTLQVFEAIQHTSPGPD